MWDQTKGWVPMKKGSCAHRLTRCSYVHSDLQNQLFWGAVYPTTHTQYSVCIIPYANMPDFGQRAPCQIHL